MHEQLELDEIEIGQLLDLNVKRQRRLDKKRWKKEDFLSRAKQPEPRAKPLTAKIWECYLDE